MCKRMHGIIGRALDKGQHPALSQISYVMLPLSVSLLHLLETIVSLTKPSGAERETFQDAQRREQEPFPPRKAVSTGSFSTHLRRVGNALPGFHIESTLFKASLSISFLQKEDEKGRNVSV